MKGGFELSFGKVQIWQQSADIHLKHCVSVGDEAQPSLEPHQIHQILTDQTRLRRVQRKTVALTPSCFTHYICCLECVEVSRASALTPHVL